MEGVDPETLFLLSEQKTGNEWELFKENVRPLKRGRNVSLLNESLKSHNNNKLKQSLIETRRKLIQEIDEYNGDDPLQPWLDCIKWVQEAFPSSGDGSALVIIYEQCVRAFWHSDRYKEDLRYLKVWLEYADNCSDGGVIYIFLDENRIGQSHSLYFVSYALFMESKNKYKNADDIFNCGISRNAQPREKLEAAYRMFLARSMKRPTISNEDPSEDMFPVRSFGTVLASDKNRILPSESSDLSKKRLKTNRTQNPSISIYKDGSSDANCVHEADVLHTDFTAWDFLGSRAERNKENNALPSKWKTNKIPQRQGSRTGPTATNSMDVYIDEECSEAQKTRIDVGKISDLELQKLDGWDVRKEMVLLRKNPLRNFR